MERNVMGELNVYRGSGAKPNFSEIARRHGMDRHTVAKYWREGESAADGRSARGSAFDPLEEVIRAKAQLPGMTKMAVYAFLREGRGEGLPGYGAFTAWCRARDVPFGGAGGREPHPRFETPRVDCRPTTTRWRTRGGRPGPSCATPRPRYSRAPPTAAATGR